MESNQPIKEKPKEPKKESKKQREKKDKKDPRAYTFTREVKEVCIRFD